MMRVIGVTGGVGAGKSELLHYLDTHYACKVVLSDIRAKELMEPGSLCYGQLQELFAGADVWQSDGAFDREKLAKVLFAEHEKRAQLNAIVHPAVGESIRLQIEEEKQRGELDFFVVEAALLIESSVGAMCDELWYIYTPEEIRRERLKASRGYSDEKIDAILKSQLSDEMFRVHCQVVIDNGKTVDESFAQIDQVLSGYGYKKKA